MILRVMIKELVDHARDRRSVVGSFVLPVMGPLLLLGVFQLVSDLSRDRALSLPVVGSQFAPRLIDYLEASGAEILPAPIYPEDSVRRGESDVVLVIDPSYAERFAEGRSAPVRLIVDESRHDAHRSVRRIERLLVGYAQGLGALRLMARGISPEVASPLELEEIDLATPEKLAANLLNVVPLFLMLAALVGGMNVAIDTTAGERERGSLEALLLNPVSRRALVLGKWLATSLASLAVASVTLLGFMLMVRFLPLEELGMKMLLGPYEAAVMWAAIAPLALFGAGLQMLIATFARSFKEAQTYLNLLNLLPMAPSMFLMFEPARSAAWMLPLPALAQVGTVVDVMRGEPVAAWHLGVILLTSLAYTAVCLFALERLLRNEKIIFGRP
jgi:sodium transport system permease protein